MDTSRRGLLRLAGGGAIGAPLFAAAKALGFSSKPTPSLVSEAVSKANVGTLASSISPRDHPLFAALSGMERMKERRYRRKAHGLDPDIDCLKSVSPSIKSLMQENRNSHEENILDKLRKEIYPSVDERGFLGECGSGAQGGSDACR